MQLKFDWLIVLENLRRGIMVTDTFLDGPAGPRIVYVNRAWLKMTGYDRNDIRGQTPRLLQGRHSDRTVLRTVKTKLLNREVFHGQTWNYRRSGEPFMMNWYCYAIYGELGRPIYYVAEQEDVTGIETLRMRERLLVNPDDPEAMRFFSVLEDFRASRKKRA
jgi:PAS domain S-box-containing protein